MKRLFIAALAAATLLAGCANNATDRLTEPLDQARDGLTDMPATQEEQDQYNNDATNNTPMGLGVPAAQGTGLDNTQFGWGIKKSKDGAIPEIPAKWQDLLKRYDSYYVGDTSKKELYLTFDMGYENGYTSQILDTLKEKKVQATFFCTGQYLTEQEDLVKRMVAEGHYIGNHTVKHPSMPSVSDEVLKKEITDLDDMFYKITGQHMQYFRPPKGEFSERTLAITKELGYKTIFWSSAYVDWNQDVQKGKDYAIAQVTSQFHNGNIILLHAVSKDNAEALGDIIQAARDAGYEFKSLDNL